MNNIHKYGSDKFFELFSEARKLYNENKLKIFNEDDKDLLNTNLGEFDYYEGELVPLDFPFLEEEYKGKKVNLNKPFRTPVGPGKFSVYVKNDKGNVVKVNFGDPNSKIKNNNLERAKNFQARQNCKDKKDRTTPGYWSCNVARYSKQLGLSSDRPW